MNTTQIGDITEERFILFCLERDIPICRPVGNNLPYDFIIELNGELKKIQVKTGYCMKTSSPNVFHFNTRSTSKNYSEVVMNGYEDKIDYFATTHEMLKGVFILIPIEKSAKSSMTIYCGETPKPNQNCYKDYMLNMRV